MLISVQSEATQGAGTCPAGGLGVSPRILFFPQDWGQRGLIRQFSDSSSEGG